MSACSCLAQRWYHRHGYVFDTYTLENREREYNIRGSVTQVLTTHSRSIKALVASRPELLFPAHTSNDWLAFQIDFKAKSIAYGDSFYPSPGAPSPTMKGLQLWLKTEFGREFEMKDNTLNIGIQSDSHSCGICTTNAIAHAVLGDALWKNHEADMFRMQLYLDLVNQIAITACGSSGVIVADLPLNPSSKSMPSYSQNVSIALQPSPSISGLTVMDIDEDEFTCTVVHPFFTGHLTLDLKASHSKPMPPSSPQRKKSKKEVQPTNGNSVSDGAGPVGISRSVRYALKDKEEVKRGRVDEVRLKRFKETIFEKDPKAKFDITNIWRVRCGMCSKWHSAKPDYQPSRILEHITKSSNGRSSQKITPSNTLVKMAQTGMIKFMTKPVASEVKSLPCSGLTAKLDAKIKAYLRRSGAQGGGSQSLTSLTK
ncbi:hypothetical protein M422DRAFT_267587 [Sphaerobolus stellatus SS14]|uniref:Ubiquitin-like protease family profile domain-containing protein n=1 Tax=Sphaerobolus stellatus (strain SS14) TaxID=990650 RepID=A0A0C9TLV3_SPHS4|nr:hypothetical protein M422DRAFT_267587 [Sphaerobolus stellatus SS14]